MIITNFDFNHFFNIKNLTNNKIVREYGIGAVSLITPTQTITQINEPDLQYRIPGLGHHNITETNIAKKILDINENTNNIPNGTPIKALSGWLTNKITSKKLITLQNETSHSIDSFLNSIIRIHYISSIRFDFAIIKLPSFTSNNANNLLTDKISKEMYEQIKEIFKQLQLANIPSDCIDIKGLTFIENYEQVIEYLHTLIEPNLTFPFKERILESQPILHDESER